jgi:hypothetical protein
MGVYYGYRIFATLNGGLGNDLGQVLRYIDECGETIPAGVKTLVELHSLYRLIFHRRNGSAYFEFTSDNHGNLISQTSGEADMNNADVILSQKDGRWVIDFFFSCSTSRFPGGELDRAAKLLGEHLDLEVGVSKPFLMAQYEEDRGLSRSGDGIDNKTSVYFAKLSEAGKVEIERRYLDIEICEEAFPNVATATAHPDRFYCQTRSL